MEDAGRGLVAVLNAPLETIASQVFNVGSDEQNFTIAQVGELVRDRVHHAQMIVDRDIDDARNYRVSFRKIRQQLGFVPQRSVSDGIQQVLEAIANGNIDSYDDPQYSNAKYLSAEGSIKLAQHQWAHKMLQELHQ